MIEALLWCAVGLLAAPAAGWLRARWPRLERARPFAPWLYGLAIPFAALLRGSVTPREFGLGGFEPASWFATGVPAAVALAALAFLIRRRSFGWEKLDPVDALCDEGRWGLYRAAGVAWSSGFLPGTLIGLGLAWVEGYARFGRRREARDWVRLQPLDILRPAASAIFFLLSHNAWITVLAQAVLILAASRKDYARRGDLDDGSGTRAAS